MSIELKKGIYFVGAKDWSVRNFHGYQTDRGTTYNAYLIIDEKIVLVDTVKAQFTDEMLERISEIIDPSKIDVVISNHVEMDHSGGLPRIMEIAPNAELWSSAKGIKGLAQHYDTTKWKTRAVSSGEAIKIGARTINFFMTPMVHWPDSMVAYIPEEKLLLPNDAFGQHIAFEKMFDDENSLGILLEEASKYYANIVYPYGGPTTKALDALQKLDIDMIAPSHGVIWKKHIPEIVQKYRKWANHGHESKAVIVFDSMWGATEKLANVIRLELERNDIPVVFRALSKNHISNVVNDILEAKYVFIGSPTLNNMVMPTVGGFLSYIEGLKPQDKVGFAFGSYGWNANIIKQIESVMERLKWKMPVTSANANYRPDDDTVRHLKESVRKIIEESNRFE